MHKQIEAFRAAWCAHQIDGKSVESVTRVAKRCVAYFYKYPMAEVLLSEVERHWFAMAFDWAHRDA